MNTWTCCHLPSSGVPPHLRPWTEVVGVPLQNPKPSSDSNPQAKDSKRTPWADSPCPTPQEAAPFGQCGFWPWRKGKKETRGSKRKHGIWHVCARVRVKESVSSGSCAGAEEQGWAALVPARRGRTHARLAVDTQLTVVSGCRHVPEFLFQRFHSCVFTGRFEWGEGSCAVDVEWGGDC